MIEMTTKEAKTIVAERSNLQQEQLDAMPEGVILSLAKGYLTKPPKAVKRTMQDEVETALNRLDGPIHTQDLFDFMVGEGLAEAHQYECMRSALTNGAKKGRPWYNAEKGSGVWALLTEEERMRQELLEQLQQMDAADLAEMMAR